MNGIIAEKIVKILLVEDNPGDVRLTKESLEESNIPNSLNVVNDGVEAIKYLRNEKKYAAAERPDIIFLDINLPKKNGLEVLAEIKKDPQLKRIPVIILTTSRAEQDIINAYNLHANCYIIKPLSFEGFLDVIKAIKIFWFSVVELPSN
jgi:two-component system, chemotaxis family, response regulator Rcp1